MRKGRGAVADVRGVAVACVAGVLAVALWLAAADGARAALATPLTFTGPPSILKIGPLKKGPASGGTEIQITGSLFEETTEVLFGDTPAIFRIGECGCELYAISPPHAGGKFFVRVVSPFGESPETKKGVFNFIGMEVAAISPSGGPHTGGTSVTVTGAGFTAGDGTTLFKFGKAFATGVECSSTTECTMTTPAANRAGAATVIASMGRAKSKKSPGGVFDYE
jgi:hypothetical protein